MEDIYSAARDGNVRFVRQWLDNVENDLNQGYVYGMSGPKQIGTIEIIIVAERKIMEDAITQRLLCIQAAHFPAMGNFKVVTLILKG